MKSRAADPHYGAILAVLPRDRGAMQGFIV